MLCRSVARHEHVAFGVNPRGLPLVRVKCLQILGVLKMRALQPCRLGFVSRSILLIALIVGISACKGIDPSKSPAKTFDVDVSVKTAYERAIAQSEMCLVTQDRFPLTSQIDPDEKFALVRVNMSMTDTLLSSVRIVADSATTSRVSVQMWGVDPWNMTAVDAMQAAIEFGVPSCINYFPSQSTKKRS